LKQKDKPEKPSPQATGECEAKSSPIRFALDTLPGVVREICAVYRLMRKDELDHGKGRSLVWVLSMLRAALETQALERLEQRLEELAPSIEGKTHGHTTASRPSGSTH
jgi:hypothetical protein